MKRGVVSPDFDKYKGRDAAVRRSDFLDILGTELDEFLVKYPSGLQEVVIKQRQENKQRILKIFGATEEDWKDYKWHYRNVIKDNNGLKRMKQVVSLSHEEEKAIKLALQHKIPFGITPHYLHLMDPEERDFDYAVRTQVIPPLQYVETMVAHKNDRAIEFDFMREHDTSPVEHITRRYAKVCILKPYDTCPQICVYCQRNWEITSPFHKNAQVNLGDLDKALKWLSKHDQIMDILITGGDPLTMNNQAIDNLLTRLSDIPHITSIRMATRTPVTVPQRIDDDLVKIIAKHHVPFQRIIYFVTHFEHPYEICPEGAEAILRLKREGINFYNQQVFNFANSRRFESVALRMALKMIGVDPYYIFNMKGKSEMEDYSVPIARVLQEVKEEARLLPGIYRTDEPVFNVPFLGKNHMRARQDHELISILPDGRRQYAFHPWEKNIRGVESYIYTDVPIRSYLEKLKERGEDTEDYRSIWYYY
jgi:lysine 2,3-aminomutase